MLNIQFAQRSEYHRRDDSAEEDSSAKPERYDQQPRVVEDADEQPAFISSLHSFRGYNTRPRIFDFNANQSKSITPGINLILGNSISGCAIVRGSGTLKSQERARSSCS